MAQTSHAPPPHRTGHGSVTHLTHNKTQYIVFVEFFIFLLRVKTDSGAMVKGGAAFHLANGTECLERICYNGFRNNRGPDSAWYIPLERISGLTTRRRELPNGIARRKQDHHDAMASLSRWL